MKTKRFTPIIALAALGIAYLHRPMILKST